MEDNATRGGWFIQSLGSICAQKGKALCLYTERFFMVPQAVHTHAKIMNLLLERYLKIKKQESALVRFSLDLVLAETEKISKESPSVTEKHKPKVSLQGTQVFRGDI